MFYGYVKSKLEKGAVKVNLPQRVSDGRSNIYATGIAAIAVLFLSQEEKGKLETLSRYFAMRKAMVLFAGLDYY